MNDLIKILPKVLLNAGFGDDAKEQAAFAAWAAAAGRHVSNITAPIRLEKKTLVVAVMDETWRSQLRGISAQLLFKVNALLGSPTISRLEMIVNEGAVRSAHKEAPTVDFLAPDQHAASLAVLADSIPLPPLRSAFLRAAGKCLDRMAR